MIAMMEPDRLRTGLEASALGSKVIRTNIRDLRSTGTFLLEINRIIEAGAGDEAAEADAAAQ